MVRRCAVPYCTNSDQIILSHRFPRRLELAARWSSNLELDSIYSLPELVDKFIICCLHFDESSYRNPKSNHLNVTAVPKREPENPRYRKLMVTKCDQESPPINTNYATVVEVQDIDYDQMINGDEANEIARFEMEINEDDGDDEPEVSPADETTDYFQVVVDALDWERSSLSPEAIIENSPPEPDHLQNTSIIADYADSLNDVIDYNRSSEEDESEEELSDMNSFGEIRKYDAAVQVDRDELERSAGDDEYAEFSRSELIGQLKEALASVGELQQKLDNFQTVHSKLQQSLEAFKNLMGNL